MIKKHCAIKMWFKRQWKAILLILFGVALLIGNICVLLYVSEINGQSAWLTLFSGWVSGIATIILGVIAVVQNKKYKEENDEFELHQLQSEWRIEQKEEIKLYLNNIIKIYDQLQQYQYIKVANDCFERLSQNHNSIIDIAYSQTLKDINYRLKCEALNTIYYFDGIEELIDLCEVYITDLVKQLGIIDMHIENGNSEFLDELYSKFEKLTESFNSYISKIRLFICTTMTNNDPKNIEGCLKRMVEKQNAWRRSFTTKIKEQNNG